MLGPILFSLAALTACGSLPETSGSTAAHNLAAYEHSIVDAAVATPAKARNLVPLPPTDKVRVLSWVSTLKELCAGGQTQCEYTVGKYGMFVTLAGEVQRKCRTWGLTGAALRLRLEQLHGLPPDQPIQYLKARFVVLEAPTAQLLRPCLGLDEADPGHPRCGPDIKQSDRLWPLAAVGDQMARSYVAGSPNTTGYPFTRLGYTYDWNEQSPDHYGASEFVLAPGTVTQVLEQMPTDAYCAPAN